MTNDSFVVLQLAEDTYWVKSDNHMSLGSTGNPFYATKVSDPSWPAMRELLEQYRAGPFHHAKFVTIHVKWKATDLDPLADKPLDPNNMPFIPLQVSKLKPR